MYSVLMQVIGSLFGEDENSHWAFQSIIDYPVPVVQDNGWSKNEIDAFIFDKLNKKGLSPTKTAANSILQRRLHYTLVGLPPVVKALDSFQFDQALEELLASPHYGEKWARHWMDVARYADSNGLDENLAFAHAWRYRDYLIDVFNQDLPFDRFVVEQLAGDILAAGKKLDEANRLKIATGFFGFRPKAFG